MICLDCARAADVVAGLRVVRSRRLKVIALDGHERCVARNSENVTPDCDCQHRFPR